MHLLAQYTLTSEEALKGTRAFKRRWYEAATVSGAILVLFGLYGLLAARASWGFSLIMTFNGLLLLIMPEAVLRWAERRRGSEAYPPTEVTLDDAGLTLRTPSSEGGLPWSAFSRIQRHSGFWIFTINRSQAVIFPERALDENASLELTRFLQERKTAEGMNLQGPVPLAARSLLGQLLVRGGITLRITEVEAYDGPGDSASHARHGRTSRNAPMWGLPGRAYLYFCYGMHWMLNVVTGPEGQASAVLIRSAEVVSGLDAVLSRRRATRVTPLLCAGPGKVAQALGLDRSFDGHDLLAPGGLELHPGPPPALILAGPRLGIAFASIEDQARPWRFADAGSSAVLKKQNLAPLEA